MEKLLTWETANSPFKVMEQFLQDDGPNGWKFQRTLRKFNSFIPFVNEQTRSSFTWLPKPNRKRSKQTNKQKTLKVF